MQERFSRHHTSIAIPTAQALQLSLNLEENHQLSSKTTAHINIGNSKHFISSLNLLWPSVTKISSPRLYERVQLQKTKTERDLHYMIRSKRNTLPLQTERQNSLFKSGHIQAPSQRLQMRVNFTYNKLDSNQPSNTLKYISSKHIGLSRPQTNLPPQRKSKAQKRRCGRLCSEVFNISYSPKIEESIRKNGNESSLFRSRQSKTNLKPYESQITVAQTTISAMGALKDSQIPQHYSRSGTELEQKEEYTLVPKEKRCFFALTDQLAPSKRLDKTVMLSQKGYDFGGLLSGQINKQTDISPEPLNPFRTSSDSFQGWTQFKGFLTEQEGTDLKESIHCGPDIRSSLFVCTVLQGFGRQIKESCVGFQE